MITKNTLWVAILKGKNYRIVKKILKTISHNREAPPMGQGAAQDSDSHNHTNPQYTVHTVYERLTFLKFLFSIIIIIVGYLLSFILNFTFCMFYILSQ